MPAPTSRRGAPPPDDPVPSRPTHPPPADPHHSEPPIRLRYGGFEIAAKGASAVYAACLLVCVAIGARVLPSVVDSARELSNAMTASAATLRTVSADVIAAREGVEKIGAAQARFDDRLGKIEGDIGELRRDLRATCAPGRK